ncbi:MAG TPA: cytochrome P450 [Actinomycetota bacterium]|nr:cytochrome P450 [Actinomycetota bacterium]
MGAKTDVQEELLKLVSDPAARADPYPVYERIRAADNAYLGELGFWFLTSYEDCAAVMRHPLMKRRHQNSWEVRGAISNAIGRAWFEGASRSMLWLDSPDHARIRGLASRAFTPRYLAKLRPRIEEMVEGLITKIEKESGVDFIDEFALALPMMVICEMLGVPAPDREGFRRWTVALAATLEPLPSEAVQDAADEASHAFNAYFSELVSERRGSSSDDLLSELIRVEQEGERLTEKELIGMAILILGAGFETTTNLIGNGMLALLTERAEWEALVVNPQRAPAVVEEVLRYDSPVQMAPPRVASAPLELGGRQVNEGHSVVAMIGAGNRDPNHYPKPANFDISRHDPAPLSFGGGPHYCIGASLARLEGAIAFRALAERLPSLKLVGDTPQWRETFNIRGLKSLEVTL